MIYVPLCPEVYIIYGYSAVPYSVFRISLKSMENRMSFVKRKASGSAKVTPEEFDKQNKNFLRDMRNVISMAQIPSKLILNFDQTGITFIPFSYYTMEKEGATPVEVIEKDDRTQTTLVFFQGLYFVTFYFLKSYMNETLSSVVREDKTLFSTFSVSFHPFSFLRLRISHTHQLIDLMMSQRRSTCGGCYTSIYQQMEG